MSPKLNKCLCKLHYLNVYFVIYFHYTSLKFLPDFEQVFSSDRYLQKYFKNTKVSSGAGVSGAETCAAANLASSVSACSAIFPGPVGHR